MRLDPTDPELPPVGLSADGRLSLELLSLGTLSSDPRDFLIRFAELMRPMIGADAVLIWLGNKTAGRFELIAPLLRGAEPSPSLSAAAVSHLLPNAVSVPCYELSGVADSTVRLAAPLRAFGQTAGAIEVQFSAHTAARAERSRLVAELAHHASRIFEAKRESQMIRCLNEALSKVAEAETVEALEESLLAGAFSITGCHIGSVLRLNKHTGSLELEACNPRTDSKTELSMDEGITGHCLRTLRPIRLDDVSKHKYFTEYWPNIQSELAVPLYVPGCTARVAKAEGYGTHLVAAPKRIGVVDVESPLPGAFSELEEQCLGRLALTAAVAMDRLESREALQKLQDAEAELAKHLADTHDWRDVVTTVGLHIRTTLAYSHINISIISPDRKRIKSEYVWWTRSEQEKSEFRSLSDHDVAGSPDIQAHVVRGKQIEVPKPEDNRFHPKIHHRFGLESLVRVYIPMMMGDEVVGTLEAGYRRRFRQFIFERDIQILKALGDYAAAAIWKKRRAQLDVLRHEIAAPRRAIMDNAMFLQRHWPMLSQAKIIWKLGDIFLDAEVMDSLLDKIEYYATGHVKESNPEFCNVGATVIQKTIFQQNNFLNSLGFDLGRIIYSRDDLTKVRTVVDQVKASEVFNNLFANAIKYRKLDDSLQIRVTVEVQNDCFLIRISDDGVGIEPDCEERIFEEGFRGANAVGHAQGSGLGLWLARRYLREMGGEIMLERGADPTVFCVRLVRREQP